MAIRNILPGEQITDEYGTFNPDEEITLVCGEAKVLNLDTRSKYTYFSISGMVISTPCGATPVESGVQTVLQTPSSQFITRSNPPVSA